MKCIDGAYTCNQIGTSGGAKVCGKWLACGETVFINDGTINEVCPLDNELQH